MIPHPPTPADVEAGRHGEKLAHLMRTFREVYEYNTQAAGDHLGLSRRTIEGIEQGRGFPSAPVVLGIALAHLIARKRPRRG